MRIAEKNLERRAKRCSPPTRLGPDADYKLAVAMLEFAARFVVELLGDRDDEAATAYSSCMFAADAIMRGWLTPCHALRYGHQAIARAAE